MTDLEIIVNVISDEENEKVFKSFNPVTNQFDYTPVPVISKLDLYGNDSIDFTFEINDVRNIIDKRSSYSKTITLPDTGNNRKIFSFISDLDGEGNFNPKRKTKCWVSVDTIVIFKGFLQLKKYNVKKANYSNYEILITQGIASFKSTLGDTKLESLPWGAISAKWDASTIQETWDLTKSTPLYFPLIDYGWNLRNIQLSNWSSSYGYLPYRYGPSVYSENFYPGIYLKEYMDRIIQEAGFRYESNFFNSDDFRKIFIPYNGNQTMLKYDRNEDQTGSYAYKKYFKATRAFSQLLAINYAADTGSYFEAPLEWDVDFDDPGNNWNTILHEYINNSPAPPDYEVFKENFVVGLELWAERLGVDFNMMDTTGLGAEIFKIELVWYRSFENELSTTDGAEWLAGRGYEVQKFVLKDMTDTETLTPISNGLVEGGTKPGIYGAIQTKMLENQSYARDYISAAGADLRFRNSATIRHGEKFRWSIRFNRYDYAISYYTGSASFLRNNVSTEVCYGSRIDVGNIVPKNIKCIDFFRSIVNIFNLYIEPKKDEPNVLIIEPRNDYNDTGVRKDWSDKLDLNSDIGVDVIAELTPRYTKYKWKDGEDYWNKTYLSYVDESYGEYTFDNFNEFTSDEQISDSLFTPTPSVLIPGDTGGANFIIPSLVKAFGTPDAPVYTNQPDMKWEISAIRILYANKRQALQKMPLGDLDRFHNFFFGLPYNPTLFGGLLGIVPFYPYSGSLDDPYFPTHDLNWGTPTSYFYILQDGLSTTQFNLIKEYWETQLIEITGQKSRLVSVKMKLTAKDIREFSFSDTIILNFNHSNIGLGSGAFRINKISGYNPSIEGTCNVELIKIY